MVLSKHGTLLSRRSREDSYHDDLYQPLNASLHEVRLLHVGGSSGSRHLTCELRTVSLLADLLPDYETISYCWGERTKTKSIKINGQARKVPISAVEALVRMRFPAANRVLWIDAICINQEDSTEKAHQVAMMYDIYSKGRRNLIWLGKEVDSTWQSIKALEIILQDAKEETRELENFYNTVCGKTTKFRVASRGFQISRRRLESTLHSVSQIYKRPWFKRLWHFYEKVVQEAALSRENVCFWGKHSLRLEDVLRGAAWLYYKRRFLLKGSPHWHTLLRNAVEMWDLMHQQRSALGLEYLLGKLEEFETHDPRDHVYGLLGLYLRNKRFKKVSDFIAPDYEKSLSEALRDATLLVLEESQHLKIFGFVDSRSEYRDHIPDLPSWVPISWNGSSNEEDALGLPNFFNASRGGEQIERAVHDKAEPGRLVVDGFVLGGVLHALPAIPPGLTSKGKSTLGVQRLVCDIRGLFLTVNSNMREHELGRILIAAENGQREAAGEQDCCDITAWLNYISSAGAWPPALHDLDPSLADSDVSRASRYHRAFRNAVNNRRPFVTDSRHMGLGPKTLELDDIVALIYECIYPVILRPEGDHYRVLGVAYIDGIMYGEAVHKHKTEGRSDMRFKIY